MTINTPGYNSFTIPVPGEFEDGFSHFYYAQNNTREGVRKTLLPSYQTILLFSFGATGEIISKNTKIEVDKCLITGPIKQAFDYTLPNNFSDEFLADFIMERFSNWLNSYTKAFNKMYELKGSLFIDYMRRVQVQGDEQFSATIFYIHKNPVHHGLVKKLEDWKRSSYKSFFSKGETSLQRDKVIEMFQGIDAFATFHQQTVYLKNAVVTED